MELQAEQQGLPVAGFAAPGWLMLCKWVAGGGVWVHVEGLPWLRGHWSLQPRWQCALQGAGDQWAHPQVVWA